MGPGLNRDRGLQHTYDGKASAPVLRHLHDNARTANGRFSEAAMRRHSTWPKSALGGVGCRTFEGSRVVTPFSSVSEGLTAAFRQFCALANA